MKPTYDELTAENASLRAKLGVAAKALQPFACAADVSDDAPPKMAVMRASFDYSIRYLGRDNSEIVETDSVRVSDLRRAREALRALHETGDGE